MVQNTHKGQRGAVHSGTGQARAKGGRLKSARPQTAQVPKTGKGRGGQAGTAPGHPPGHSMAHAVLGVTTTPVFHVRKPKHQDRSILPKASPQGSAGARVMGTQILGNPNPLPSTIRPATPWLPVGLCPPPGVHLLTPRPPEPRDYNTLCHGSSVIAALGVNLGVSSNLSVRATRRGVVWHRGEEEGGGPAWPPLPSPPQRPTCPA